VCVRVCVRACVCARAHAHVHVHECVVPCSGNTLWPLHKLCIGCHVRVLCEHGDNAAW